MSKFIYVATLLLLISWCHASTDDDSSSESSDDSPKASETTESKAGEAIKTLLQEKITQKFKEAANEVKGVLVKQLGDSLKSAHEAFNPPKDKEKKIQEAIGAKATSSGSSSKNANGSGAAKIHQNKANRHRKNSGPQGTPQNPVSVSAHVVETSPNLLPNASTSHINGSNLFPNAPKVSEDEAKSVESGSQNGTKLLEKSPKKCPKKVHVLLKFKFNRRNKGCLGTGKE